MDSSAAWTTLRLAYKTLGRDYSLVLQGLYWSVCKFEWNQLCPLSPTDRSQDRSLELSFPWRLHRRLKHLLRPSKCNYRKSFFSFLYRICLRQGVSLTPLSNQQKKISSLLYPCKTSLWTQLGFFRSHKCLERESIFYFFTPKKWNLEAYHLSLGLKKLWAYQSL